MSKQILQNFIVVHNHSQELSKIYKIEFTFGFLANIRKRRRTAAHLNSETRITQSAKLKRGKKKQNF